MASPIADLNIAPSEALDLDNYAVIGGNRPKSKFPVKGRYTLRTVDSFSPESFRPNGANTALTFQIDPTIVGPTNEGKQLKFTRISGKIYQRDGKSVSQLNDYLKTVGVTDTVPGDPQEQANIVEQTAGRVFEAGLDWRAYAKGANADGSDLSVEGMENFPSNGAGGFLPYLNHPTVKDDEGKPKKIWANLEIVYFVPQSA